MNRVVNYLLVPALGLCIGISIATCEPLIRPVLPDGNTALHSSIVNPAASIGGVTDWAISSATVEELYSAADVVVRAKIGAQQERLEKESVALYQIEGIDPAVSVAEQLDKFDIDNPKTIQVGTEIVYTPYIDSSLEKVEVFKGDLNQSITVTQLGGSMPHPVEKDKTIEIAGNLEGNPVLELGKEYILFLEHMEGSSYGVINPLARYQVEGALVHLPIDPVTILSQPISVPTTVVELVARIRQQAAARE